MKPDCRIGGGTSALNYRHPLVSRISSFFACLQNMPDAAVHRQVRWTPLATATAAVLMALDHGCPLYARFEDARVCMGSDFVQRRRVGGSYNGLMKALERQAASVLPVLKKDLRRQAHERLDRIHKTAGWRLLAVDGSKEDVPRTVDHEKAFGIADNGAYPQALLTAIVEVHTGLIWDWRMDRGRASERDHLLQMAPDLPAEALLLGDGYFVGFPIWSELDRLGKPFLIRAGGNVHLITRLWTGAVVRREHDVVYAWPAALQHKVPPLKLRLIRIGQGPKAVYLLTNVLDPRRLSQRAAGTMYRCRWGVELFFRTLKRTLGYAKLRSKVGRRARIELEWGLITMMITAMLGIDSLGKRRIPPHRWSPARTIRTLRASLLRGAGKKTHRLHAALDRAIASSLKDSYRRRNPKWSRHRPKTKNTPRSLILQPPNVRRATALECERATKYRPLTAA